MSEHITIDFTRVADTVDRLSTAATTISGILDTLDQKLATLETQWAGEAFAAYRQMRQDWFTHMTALQTRLDSYAKVLDKTGTTMQKTESTLATSF